MYQLLLSARSAKRYIGRLTYESLFWLQGDQRIRAKVRFRLVNWPLQLRWLRVLSKEPVPGMVSIIIPTYRRYRELGEAIESVLAQTVSNWELIVVSDGHDQNTEKLVRKYRDARVRYSRSLHVGYYGGHQRNVGTLKSNGEYLFYLDDDNLLYTHALEIFLDGFAKAETGYVVCPIVYGSRIMTPTPSLKLTEVDTLNFMIRRSVLKAIGGWSWHLGHDQDLIMRASHLSQGNFMNCDPIGIHR